MKGSELQATLFADVGAKMNFSTVVTATTYIYLLFSPSEIDSSDIPRRTKIIT